MIADNRDELVAWLRGLDACYPAIFWAKSLPLDHGLNRAWAICDRSDWMLWLTKHLDIHHFVLRRIACDFARSVLYLVAAGEERPRLAIETAERFVGGSSTLEELKAASSAAGCAVKAASSQAARSVAYAALHASTTYGGPSRSKLTVAAVSFAAFDHAAAADRAARSRADAWDAAWDAHANIIRRRTAGLTIGRRT